MKSNRRNFLTTALAGGLAATLPLSSCSGPGNSKTTDADLPDYSKLDEVLRQPVLKKELFTIPVIIASLELLRYKDSFLCRVRSKDGAEGIAFTQDYQMASLYPLFVNRLQPFFIGKDARELEGLLEEVTVYESNYKLEGLALWIPIATIEFAILDMLGRIANLSIGQLIGEIHHPEVAIYKANSERDISAEETIEHLQEHVASSNAKAIKLKVGGRMSHPEYPPGRTEKLIPLARKTFGDQMIIYADANGSYNVEDAIRVGKLLEDNNYAFYEEPVPFGWYEETKQVARALNIPIAGGEQEPSLHNFRWLIANNALSIVQADMIYFGGLVRCMKVARMAAAAGKVHTPHTSSLGYLYMLHFVSAIPNAGPYMELKSPNLDEIPMVCKTSTLMPNEEGIVKVPTGPGLGIDVDPDYIKKHVVVKG